MSATITFLGAAQTVTGSKYLVKYQDKLIMVDCGVFQGSRQLRESNWDDLPVNPASIDAVIITHAHIDHTGCLPRYVANGLRCPIFSTAATETLCGILLPDMARLQEQEAQYRDQRKRSRHKPPKPFYTSQDAAKTLKLFRSVPFFKPTKILKDVSISFYPAGHILGAACVNIDMGSTRLTFSGDLGRYEVPILLDPTPVELGNLLLIESTYGTHDHPDVPAKEMLSEIITATVARKGIVLVPSFAVGRVQLLLYYLRELKQEGKIPDIPIIIDSPMASDATEAYRNHPECYDDQALGILSEGKKPFSCSKLAFISEQHLSIKLNKINDPMVIISPSGMLTGGRILHHLKHRIGEERNTILFVGHQPAGGRGAWIQGGASSLRLFGQNYPIRAQIATISGFSAHAGRNELLRWARESRAVSKSAPDQVAVIHGELPSSEALASGLQEEHGWNCTVPALQSVVSI